MIWVYSSEVTAASAMSLVTFGVFGMLFLQSMTIESLMDSQMQPEGVFFLFGAITITGFFYVYFLMKETVGLSDK